MNDQLKQRLVGAIVLVSLAVIFLPMIFKGDGGSLNNKSVPPEPDYRFPPPKEAPKAPPMAKAPIVPVGDSTKDGGEQEKKIAPVVPKASEAKPPEKEAPKLSARNKKKEAETEVSKPGQVNAWIVQVGSFSGESNAIALRDRLRKMGFASFVEAVKGDQGMVYRVRVGPELTRELAEKLNERLVKNASINGLVQSYP